tara:strand:+ start:2346 stop:2657 length:312 start_codon:yes stop_codon:yes gene_type:complete
MGVRDKRNLLETGYKHFKDYDLPLDIDQKSYINIVGRGALPTAAVKRRFKAWKYFLVGLKTTYPDLSKPKAPPPPPPPEPKVELPKKDPLEALREKTVGKNYE